MHFLATPSHGYLVVPAAEVEASGAEISTFSYRHGDLVYLEEDCDASAFINATGIDFSDIEVRHQASSTIPGIPYAPAEKIRRAEVRNARDAEQVAAYLPSNYRVVKSDAEQLPGHDQYGLVVTIEGADRAGWTMDDYIIPRLASGLIYATEIPASDG